MEENGETAEDVRPDAYGLVGIHEEGVEREEGSAGEGTDEKEIEGDRLVDDELEERDVVEGNVVDYELEEDDVEMQDALLQIYSGMNGDGGIDAGAHEAEGQVEDQQQEVGPAEEIPKGRCIMEDCTCFIFIPDPNAIQPSINCFACHHQQSQHFKEEMSSEDELVAERALLQVGQAQPRRSSTPRRSRALRSWTP
ncbi:hypothetical protein BJ508DRAFT_73198 [Ascobolus immersus RN42]|uniref:Uncharacterized protein n=1 Tax=Ascobolus immersus RN42 TaxID=1160509 RepID=A0A3N4HDZ2_ASCIM|nr:hypothetical protein BJ508DRAFT_73198 [Ascobolus immersus RN42]